MTEPREKRTPPPLPFKACLYSDPASPHYFDSYQSACNWLKQNGEGQIKKRSLVEFAFPLEQKKLTKVWVNLASSVAV